MLRYCHDVSSRQSPNSFLFCYYLPMNTYRKSAVYLACAMVVLILGLASRRYGSYLPPFIATYAGDTLWALLVFLGGSALMPGLRLSYRAGMAVAFAFFIEVSQRYHAPWIDALRDTTLGGLVLGFGFLWSDLLCYGAGIGIGVAAVWAVRGLHRRDAGK